MSTRDPEGLANAPPTLPAPDLFGRSSEGGEALREDELYRCIHCGLCLEHCPTYLELGLETESPRGRIALMRATYEGRLAPTPDVQRHWDLCLGCRACEAVCPSGVPYGRLIETTRAWTATHTQRPPSERLLRRFAFAWLLPSRARLRAAGLLLLLYQRSGLQWLVRTTRLLRLAPGLRAAEAGLPRVPSRFFAAKGQVYPARGVRRRRVGLLAGCVMPLFHASTMEAAVRVLVENGCEVVVPEGQGCCGALNVHSGEQTLAREMARKNVQAFLDADVEAVVVASAGCSAAMKKYDELLAGNAADAAQAARLSAKVQDITEFLASLPIEPTGAAPVRVTYQDPCHLAHAQRITSSPRELLRSIAGLELAEMARPDVCCGAAGSYQLVQQEMSDRLLDARLAQIRETGADVVATANPGCMLQLERGVRQRGMNVQVCHVVDLLAEAYRSGVRVERGEAPSSPDDEA